MAGHLAWSSAITVRPSSQTAVHGKKKTLLPQKEVILVAEVYNTPKLLDPCEVENSVTTGVPLAHGSCRLARRSGSSRRLVTYDRHTCVSISPEPRACRSYCFIPSQQLGRSDAVL